MEPVSLVLIQVMMDCQAGF